MFGFAIKNWLKTTYHFLGISAALNLRLMELNCTREQLFNHDCNFYEKILSVEKRIFFRELIFATFCTKAKAAKVWIQSESVAKIFEAGPKLF